MRKAIDILEERLRVDGFPDVPMRSHLETGRGRLLTMPSTDRGATGVKLVTVAPENRERGLPLINGVFVLFDSDTLVPVATMDAAALTELRTAAISGVATRAIARGSDGRVVIFGAGAQARAHAEAMLSVCTASSIRVVDLVSDRALALVEWLRAAGADAQAAGPDCVADADVVCTCTTSSVPLFNGDLLAADAHVNAIGAFRAEMRELDDAAIGRAAVVVETRAAALEEAGDLLIPLRDGVIKPDQIVAELPQVLRSGMPESSAEITVFKSVGHAFEDLVIASAVFEAVA